MAMVVNTNVSSLIAQSAANATNKSLDTAMERLATGKRINSAADDAAGVAIASRLEAEIRGVNQAVRNAADAQAMIDTAEGAHIEITSILQRMREIAVQSSNDSNNDSDRGYLQNEVDALANEVDRIANTSTWAGKNLIKAASSFKFLLGSEKADNEITVSTAAMTGAALGIKAGNAIVGAQGATLTEVGDTVLQVGGTPAAGDIYTFDVNGVTQKITLVADGSNFDYKHEDGSVDNGTVTAGFTQSGVGVDAVANIIAHAVGVAATTNGVHPGLEATAAADGSVTLEQDVSFAGSESENDTTKTTFTDLSGGALTWSVNGSNVTHDKAISLKIGTGGTLENVEAEDHVIFALNGRSYALGATSASATQESAFSTTDAYADNADGYAAQLQALIDADAANHLGYTINVVKVDADNLKVGVIHTGATMIANNTTTPMASSTALDVNDQASAANAINTIDTALDLVNSQRAALGAVSNRMDSAISNLTNMSTNLAGGKSRIEDADFASETAQLTKSQILQQAATSMLAQANASKQSVLSLLQG